MAVTNIHPKFRAIAQETNTCSYIPRRDHACKHDLVSSNCIELEGCECCKKKRRSDPGVLDDAFPHTLGTGLR